MVTSTRARPDRGAPSIHEGEPWRALTVRRRSRLVDNFADPVDERTTGSWIDRFQPPERRR